MLKRIVFVAFRAEHKMFASYNHYTSACVHTHYAQHVLRNSLSRFFNRYCLLWLRSWLWWLGWYTKFCLLRQQRCLQLMLDLVQLHGILAKLVILITHYFSIHKLFLLHNITIDHLFDCQFCFDLDVWSWLVAFVDALNLLNVLFKFQDLKLFLSELELFVLYSFVSLS